MIHFFFLSLHTQLITFLLLAFSFAASTTAYVTIYEVQDTIMTPLSGGCDYVKAAYVGSWLNHTRTMATEIWSLKNKERKEEGNEEGAGVEDSWTSPPVTFDAVLRGGSLDTIRFVRRKEEDDASGCHSIVNAETKERDV